METNLSKICNSIGFSGEGDVSTQASNILASITGERVEFNLAGDAQNMAIIPLDVVNNKLLTVARKAMNMYTVTLNVTQ